MLQVYCYEFPLSIRKTGGRYRYFL